MVRTQYFDSFKSTAPHLFTEEQQKQLIEMAKAANFEGKVTIVNQEDETLVEKTANGGYNKITGEIILRMHGEEKINPHIVIGEIDAFDHLVCIFAHELGHSMDVNNHKSFQTILNAVEDAFINEDVDMDVHKTNYRKDILDSEITAWEKGRKLIKNEELLTTYDKTNQLSFHIYSRFPFEKNDQTVTGHAQMNADSIMEYKLKSVNEAKDLLNRANIDFKSTGLYKKDDAYYSIEEPLNEMKEKSIEKINKQEKKFSVFLEVDQEDQSKISPLKKAINEKIAALYHPYDQLPAYMKKEKRELAYEKGLHVLVPKEDDNKLLHTLKNMKEKAKKRTVVVTEKLSNTFTEKVEKIGVKTIEKLEMLPNFINSLAEKFVSKGLRKVVDAENVQEAKNYLEMGAKADKETRLAIITSKKIKSELLPYLKPKENEKDKQHSKDIGRSL